MKIKKIILSTLLMVIILICTGCSNGNNKNNFLENLHWEMSVADIKKELSNKNGCVIINQSDNKIETHEIYFEREGYVTYYFENDKLEKMEIAFSENFDSDYLLIYKSIYDYYSEYKDNFTKKKVENHMEITWETSNAKYFVSIDDQNNLLQMIINN